MHFWGLCRKLPSILFLLAHLTTSAPLGGLNTGNVRFVASLLLPMLSDRFWMIRPPAPALLLLAFDVRFSAFSLGVQRVELLIESLICGLAGVDRTVQLAIDICHVHLSRFFY